MNDRDMRIRERAYHLWIDEGRPEGREAVHWNLARAQVAAEEEVVSTGPERADVPPVRKPRGRKVAAATADAQPAQAVAPAAAKKPRAKPAAATPAGPRAARKKG